MYKLFSPMLVAALSNGAYADEVVFDSDPDFHYGQVLYEHVSCGIQYIAAGPETDYLYIHEQLVAVIDYRGQSGVAKAISTIGTVSLEIDGSFDPVADYLDEVLLNNGLPRYQDLSDGSCLSS